MITLREVVAAIYGAYRLARLDPAGLNFFDVTVAGFWRSFFAAAIIAPVYLSLLLMRFDHVAAQVPFFRFIAIEAIAYVIAWVAFPLIMATVTKAIDRWDRFIRYIVAYNWAAVLQNALYLPIAILTTGGVMPEAVGGTLGLVALALILAYGWFIARTALDVTPAAAAAVVGLDFLLSIVINAVADGML